MKKEGADAIVEGAKDALGTAVLLRRIWTSETKNSAVRGQKGADSGVVELFTVVGLEGVNGTTELGGDVGVEGGESSGDVGLFAERKSPHKMREIIKND